MLAPDQSHSYRLLSRHSFFFAFLIATFALTAGFRFETQEFSNLQDQMGKGLEPIQRPPNGVKITSTDRSLTLSIEKSEKDPGKDSSREFFLIFPPSASLVPEIVDFQIVLNDQASKPPLPGMPASPTPAAPKPQPEKATSPTALTLTKANFAQLTKSATPMRPDQFVTAKDEGVYRFYRIVRISIQSEQISLLNKSYKTRSVVLKYSFPPLPKQPMLAEMTQTNWGFRRILSHLVANPDAMPLYAARNQSSPNTNSPIDWSPTKTDPSAKWFKTLVSDDGLYRIPGAILQKEGLDLKAANPETIRIFCNGKEIPSYLADMASGKFAAGSSIVFYGEASKSQYSREQAYWIKAGGANTPAAIRMPLKKNEAAYSDAAATTETLQDAVFGDENTLLIHSGSFLSIKGSEWIWKEIPLAEPLQFGFDLPELTSSKANPDKPISLDISFIKYDLQRRVEPPPPAEPRNIYFSANEDAPAGSKVLPPLVISVNDLWTTTTSPVTQTDDSNRILQIDPRAFKPSGNIISISFASPYETPDECSGLFIKKLKFQYPRKLNAIANRLLIRTESAAPWHRVSKIPFTEAIAFDITDPKFPSIIEKQKIDDQTLAFHEPDPGRKVEVGTIAALPILDNVTPRIDTDISNPSVAADYLIIYHPMFKNEIQPLVQLHEHQGLKVKAVDINAVYQEFSQGNWTPEAIKSFLYFSLRNWKTPPAYVCLFGDASSDYLDGLRTGVPNLIPAYSYNAGNDVWASELWYQTLIGSDLLPDIMLGRISVQNLEDAKEVVRKTVSYENGAPMGPWRGRISYCADDAGFREATQNLYLKYKPAQFLNERIFLEEMPYETNFWLKRQAVEANDAVSKISTGATVKLLDNYNRGTAMMMFMGHGSPNIWTDERIWFGGDSPNSDNLNLRNDPRLPFVATFTCNQGAFDYPMPRWHICISEDMMRAKKGGSVAMYVPTGPGITSTHEKVGQALLDSLFRENLRRVGEAINLGAAYYLLEDNSPEMLRMFVLLGDPALDLAIPTNTGEGTVTPSTVSPVFQGDTPVVFRASINTLSAGQFMAFVYDEQDQEVLRSQQIPFYDGELAWAFKLPPKANFGKWTVRAYYANPKENIDGFAWGKFQVANPVIKITSLDINPKPDKAGQKTTIQFKVSNEYDTPADIPVRLTHDDEKTTNTILFEKTIHFDGKQEQTLNVEWVPKTGIHFLKAEALRFVKPLSDQILPENIKTLVLPIMDAPTSQAISMPSLAKIDWKTVEPNASFTVTIPIYFKGYKKPFNCVAHLKDPTGSIVAQTSLRLENREPGVGRMEAALQVSTIRTSLLKPYSLEITPAPGETQKPILTLSIPLGVPRLPDLCVKSGSMIFTPSAPREGETVFMRALIENKGNALADRFAVKVSSITPNNPEVVLTARPPISQLDQPPLAPGRSRWIDLRWDYKAYAEDAGVSTIRLELDSARHIAELNRGNNIGEANLRIYRAAEVKVVDVKQKLTDITNTTKQVDITATIKNVGELEAYGRRVGFFNKVLTEADLTKPEEMAKKLVKEYELPVLSGGQEKKFTCSFKADFSDPETSPTVKAYQPTRTIRTGSGEDQQDIVEWPTEKFSTHTGISESR